MAVWVIRGGKFGEREEQALERGILTIGFGILEDLAAMSSYEDVRGVVQRTRAEATPNQIGSYAGQIWNFVSKIQQGDLVVMPRKGNPGIAIGEMTGDYEFLGPDFHGRSVSWINTDVQRKELDQDLKNSIGSIATVFRPGTGDAEVRLRAYASGEPPPVGGPSNTEEPRVEFLGAESLFDLAELGNNRVMEYVERKFSGHSFAQLVAAVLRAQGYGVEVAPAGPDGGVDIVAGSGPMAFDPPRICVQVKSGMANIHDLRELSGVISNFGADYGLLVAWKGFEGSTESEARKSQYFNVRLWKAETFLELLFENYDRLPSAMKAELPLKQIWVLDEPSM